MGVANPWRLAAAIGLIVVLGAVLMWQIVDWPSNDAADDVTINTPAPVVVDDEEPWIDAAQDALDAWASFASTGDLAVLDGFFDPEGPQYAQLVGEASTVVTGGGSYSFVLVNPTAELAEGFPVVSGTVIVSRNGETTDELEWEIHLVEVDGRWLLWTTEERA